VFTRMQLTKPNSLTDTQIPPLSMRPASKFIPNEGVCQWYYNIPWSFPRVGFGKRRYQKYKVASNDAVGSWLHVLLKPIAGIAAK